jgi:hypothetical protein
MKFLHSKGVIFYSTPSFFLFPYERPTNGLVF